MSGAAGYNVPRLLDDNSRMRDTVQELQSLLVKRNAELFQLKQEVERLRIEEAFRGQPEQISIGSADAGRRFGSAYSWPGERDREEVKGMDEMNLGELIQLRRRLVARQESLRGTIMSVDRLILEFGGQVPPDSPVKQHKQNPDDEAENTAGRRDSLRKGVSAEGSKGVWRAMLEWLREQGVTSMDMFKELLRNNVNDRWLADVEFPQPAPQAEPPPAPLPSAPSQNVAGCGSTAPAPAAAPVVTLAGQTHVVRRIVSTPYSSIQPESSAPMNSALASHSTTIAPSGQWEASASGTTRLWRQETTTGRDSLQHFPQPYFVTPSAPSSPNSQQVEASRTGSASPRASSVDSHRSPNISPTIAPLPAPKPSITIEKRSQSPALSESSHGFGIDGGITLASLANTNVSRGRKPANMIDHQAGMSSASSTSGLSSLVSSSVGTHRRGSAAGQSARSNGRARTPTSPFRPPSLSGVNGQGPATQYTGLTGRSASPLITQRVYTGRGGDTSFQAVLQASTQAQSNARTRPLPEHFAATTSRVASAGNTPSITLWGPLAGGAPTSSHAPTAPAPIPNVPQPQPPARSASRPKMPAEKQRSASKTSRTQSGTPGAAQRAPRFLQSAAT